MLRFPLSLREKEERRPTMSITRNRRSLVYRDIRSALDFLTRAFGFKETMRTGAPSGGMHGEASFQGQLVMLAKAAVSTA